MGDTKLCLLLLLSTSALAVAQDGDQPTCLLAQRYKTLHKYEYQYEAESLNAINGASLLKNGPKVSCKVEIEVPQTCSFIVRTTGCSLREVVRMDRPGNPVSAPSATSAAFAADMERYPLKVVVEGVYDVKLYPDDLETPTILNFKRGIISALAVPLMEEDKNKYMPTIHGMCRTHYMVKATERDSAIDVSLSRDLSKCDKFVPMRDHTSPLALISGMHYPLAQLVRSSQTCNYIFDNQRKHMTSGSCTENHILIPFSHKGKRGVTNVGKQKLTLVQVSPHNDRVFDRSNVAKGLHMEAIVDKSASQDKNAVLDLLRELANLPETEGERRAHLFHKLVTTVRGMKTLSPAIPEALAVSPVLTYQVLAQCGTPECSSAIMQILRRFDSSSLQVDAAVFAMGLVSNPSALLVNDMLEMARYKPSQPIMYALSNVVKRLYKTEGKLIPEFRSVAEFMVDLLDDCSGGTDGTYMTLRVIGNMAPAVVPVSSALRASLIRCVNQPAAPPSVQQAAVQVYRLTPVPEEAREILMQLLLNNANPVQKRIAAYLVLVKDPQRSELAQLADALSNEQDIQFKTFVISHINNILSSTNPESERLRQKMRAVLQSNKIGPIMDSTKFSRNYKMGSLEGNMIFEGASYLPKEAMLEMTLKAFGYDIDMMEIGMEGKGFEPTVDALFGENGFFPDTTLKTMYFVSDNMPLSIKGMLQKMLPPMRKDAMRRQASQNLMREVGRNLNKLVRELKNKQSPEAMVYLRLFGNELGYLRTNQMEEMAYSAAMMIDNMFKMFPADLIKGLMTKTDNTIFAHYIFMDNEFFLPTATGVPLRVALSGTFTPGIKGGLKIIRDMREVAFMPSAGIEFVTQFGSHMPQYVDSGLKMHSSIFHEGGLSAKITMEREQVKLTIPAPKNPTKLFKITNTLVAVIGSESRTIPTLMTDKVDVKECTPFFAGMEYCTDLQYVDAYLQDGAPYFPFTGDSKFAVELKPTGDVTEYTATVAYELLREGHEGRQKVDSVKLIVRAEGAESTEARAIMKYNRKKNTITANVLIPDFDVDAGLRLGVVDWNTKGKGTHSVSLDLINKNIPQLSLVGRANLEAMQTGMLQIQLLVPSMYVDASLTTNMKRGDDLELELRSDIQVMNAVSTQKIAMRYDVRRVEVEFKSDVNADTTSTPISDLFDNYGNQLLDMNVGPTDMKVRHTLKKFVEAANNYMDKYGADIPYIQDFRVPDMPEISLPETLFLNAESKAVYYFNGERFNIVIPLPLGGKSRDEINFPFVLNTPYMYVPMLGLELFSMEISIPDLVIPERLSLSVPLFGKAEVSALMKSNLYDMAASAAAGKDIVETPSYSAKFDVTGTSPLDILSFKIEGSGLLATTDSLKAQVKSSFVHKFMEASFSVVEDATITDRLNVRSSSKIEAKSPFGLNIDLVHTAMTGINTEEISADSSFKGMVKAGPIYGKTTSTQSFTINPFRPEAKIDSTVQLDSTIFNGQNTIAASLVSGEFSVVSKTTAFEDALMHVAEISMKDSKLSLKCNANALALGLNIRNQAEASAGAGELLIRIETNTDHSENRVYSLLTASLDVNGLAVNCDAAVKLLENEATHKATLKMNKDGLTTSGTTTLQSPLSLENTFNGGLDASGATLSINNKAVMDDIKFDNANTLTITLSSLDFNSKADASFGVDASYTHDVVIALKPYTASANVNNALQLLATNFINEAKLQAELYKMDLTGSMKAFFEEEEIKHTYKFNYADMTANAMCSTTGKLLGTQMSQNTELEIIGLSAIFTNNARFNSMLMNLDHSIRSSLIPFDFNVDATFNADGDMTMFGKHSAQLYSKFLLKAQPLAFASSHECRSSVTQQLDNGFSLETTFEENMDAVLSIQEQRTNFRVKSKMNKHAFNHDLTVQNTARITGIEFASSILTNIMNADSLDNQEFAISSSLKYDKRTNCHIISFPVMENMPLFFESIKGLVVHIAEALQDYISNPEIRTKLEALPRHVSEFVSQMNVEGTLIQLKLYFTDLSQKYVISMEDVEATVRNLKVTFEKLLADLAVYVQHFAGMMKDIFFNSKLPQAIFQKIQEQMDAIRRQYDIKAMLVAVIDTMNNLIEHINLEEVRGTSFAFLADIDRNLFVLFNLQVSLRAMKNFIVEFDIYRIVADLKEHILSDSFRSYMEELVSEFPMEVFSYIAFNIKGTIEDYDIIGRINTFFAKLRELIVKFEGDRMFQTLLEKAVELVKQFRIDETIKTVTKIVKDADIPTKFIQAFQGAINYLKTTEVKDIIQQLKTYLETNVQRLKSFNYNDFVDNANAIIAEYTAFINSLIQALEIPQKLEATRDYVNLVLYSAKGFMERLREIRVAEMIKSIKELIDQVVFDDLRRLSEFIKKQITDFDVKAEIADYLEEVNEMYTDIIDTVTFVVSSMADIVDIVVTDQTIEQIQQIFEGIMSELKKLELRMPSFTLPLTDLVVPSMKFRMDKLEEIEIPTQLDIPEFTILGFHTVKATTISFDDIKQRIIALIDFIVNFEIKMLDVDAFFGDLTMNYLPSMPEISLPEFTLPEFSFPTIPKVPVEKLVKSLRVPQFQLPTIPSEIMVPCFGKLYGEIRFKSPFYTVKTSADFQDSTETELTPQFIGSITSLGKSSTFETLNYQLNSSAHIAFPKKSRIVLTESVKFNHLAFGVDHQASLSLYGLTAQGQGKTILMVTTIPYSADFVNTAFIAMGGGMSASLETTYNHVVYLPQIDITGNFFGTQKAIARQDGYTLAVTVENAGKGKFNAMEGNHKSNMHVSLSPKIATLTFSGDTDTAVFKMKQQITAESGPLFYLKFNVRNDAEAPIIKNSLVVASGYFNLHDMKAELKANHDTELYGDVSGTLSNGLNIVARPFKFTFDLQNKGNVRFNIYHSLSAKIDVQNVYSAILKPDTQQMNALTLARLNQYKMFYNVTVNNNVDEAGVFVAMDGDADLEFLTSPIDIPEVYLPYLYLHTPGIRDLNLYELIGLKHILTTTKQNVDFDAKMVYQKTQAAPLVDMMGLIQIPAVGNLITELTFKSAIINLNVNAGLYAEDDLVFRLGATTASVFESLKAKLDGTTSLTTKRGIKLANSLSLENYHIDANHDSTISMSTETLETAVSVATVAKIILPILNLEANQSLVADTKIKANALSTLKMKVDFNIPVMKAGGNANADHSLKVEGNLNDVSIESTTRTSMDGKMFEGFLASGVLDNVADLYLNSDGVRSTSKFIADVKLNQDAAKLISMDVNENLALEASLSRVYALLKCSSNNEVNLFNFNTRGKHVAQGTIDLAPTSSLTAMIDVDMSQPSDLGDFIIFEKFVVDLSAANQKISTNTKFVSTPYTTNLAADVEGSAAVFKGTFKSSATSPAAFLAYDVDASSTANFENEDLNMISKVALNHADFNVDVSQALSASSHTINTDITSPTFTDVNLRFAARKEGISASVSTPSTGFLGLQSNGRIPSQMSTRVYGRYPSAPQLDVDIFVIRSLSKDADKMNLQIAYNMELPKVALSELKMRLPSVISVIIESVDKYQIGRNMEELKNVFVTQFNEAFTAVHNYDYGKSQLSVFFRSTIVQYQKTIQTFLDVVIKFLRETKIKLPGSEEMTTVPEVLKKLTSSIAAMLDNTIQMILDNIEDNYNSFVDKISNVKLSMPVGDARSLGQIYDQMKTQLKSIFDGVVDFVRNMENLETMLVNIGETLRATVESTQEAIDLFESDILDSVLFYINDQYRNLFVFFKDVIDQLDTEVFKNTFDYIMDTLIYVVDQCNYIVYGLLQQASEGAQAYVKVSDGRLEIELPIYFQQ